MVSPKFLLAITTYVGAVLASSHASSSEGPRGCGEVNVFMTGLPPYHPLVIALGLDPAMVDRMLHEDAARIIARGYNLRGKFAHPKSRLHD